ncbi:MAG: histidine kinase [Bacteroidota bacterium]
MQTPRQLAFVLAAIIGGTSLVLQLCFIIALKLQEAAFVLLIIPFIVFGITYFAVANITRNYIQTKIDVLYRTIRDFKMNSKSKYRTKSANDRDVLTELQTDVADWLASQTSELDSLRQLEEYRREFVGNVSHELKTPIFNIQGYLETLLDGADEDETVRQHYLQRAYDNADRLGTVVEDLNMIAKLESDTLQLQLKTFDLRELLEEVFADTLPFAQANQVSLICEPSKVLLIFVVADRERIRQILTNLITNGIKYSTNNHAFVRINAFETTDNWLIEVSDNGIGIAQQHLPRLFERFYRADPARSRAAGGSGLGLAIVKHIVEAHRQTIHVRSTENIGTTFGFTLAKG